MTNNHFLQLAQRLPVCMPKATSMKKILLGALVCAAVAGVVYYLYDPEKVKDTLGDLRDKADDALTKVKDRFSKAEKEMQNA